MKLLAKLALCAGFLLLIGNFAFAAIIRVAVSGNDNSSGSDWNSPKLTIANALSTAASGDEIWVAKGTYYERITLKSGVKLYGGFAGSESSLDQRDWSKNETIIDGQSGGSVVRALSGITTSDIISGFTIRNGYAGYGAGVYCYQGSPTISHNKIINNVAGVQSYGGGIYVQSASPVIVNNIIAGNSGRYGSGISCASSTAATIITNNTIVSNTSGYATGAGIYCSSSYAKIYNNLITHNRTGIYNTGIQPSLSHNNLYSNTLNYYGATGANDISVDPLYVDRANGDYHLSSESPCIDVGYNNAESMMGNDIDGEERVANEQVDIGADEYAAAPEYAVTTILDARTAENDTAVDITGAIVTIVFPDFFYIADDNRTCGMRVEKTAHGLTIPTRANIKGKTINNISEEPRISATSAVTNGTGKVEPVGVNNSVLGGGPFEQFQGITGGVGLSNIGLLVKTWGSVVEIDSGSPRSWFKISDGSGPIVKVKVAPGVNIDPAWRYVVVTGASSCEKSGSIILRCVLVPDTASIQVLK